MTNKFKEKQKLAELLDRLYREIDNEEANCSQEYRIVGKTDEQETHWKTGELLWEDEEKTIPKMKSKWDYVSKSADEMTEDDFAKIKACQYLKAQLEKMI